MAILRVDAILPYLSGLPEDIAVNTFHLVGPDATTPGPGLAAAFESFYNDAQGAADEPIASWISAYVSRGADDCLFRIYDAETPGPPLGEATWTLGTAGASTSLPFECAACLSYTAYAFGRAPARSRGRIYVGPLTTEASNVPSGTPPRVHPSLVETLAEAGAFLAAGPLDDDWDWAVYSRADLEAYNITAGWVDNEFDTQRRRQTEATSRTAWVGVLP